MSYKMKSVFVQKKLNVEYNRNFILIVPFYFIIVEILLGVNNTLGSCSC